MAGIEVLVSLGLLTAKALLESFMQIALKGLKPDSSGYKDIVKIIELAGKAVDNLTGKMSSAFKTSSGAKSFGREYELLLNVLTLILSKFGSIGIESLNISADLLKPLEDALEKLASLRKELDALNKGNIGLGLSGATADFDKIRNAAKELKVDLSNTTFDDFGSKLKSAVTKATPEVDKLLDLFDKLGNAIKTFSGANLNKITDDLKNIDSKGISKVIGDPKEIDQINKKLIDLSAKLELPGKKISTFTTKSGLNTDKFIKDETIKIVSAYDDLIKQIMNKKSLVESAINAITTERDKNGKDSLGRKKGLTQALMDSLINSESILNALKLVNFDFKSKDYVEANVRLKFALIKEALSRGVASLTKDQTHYNELRNSFETEMRAVFDQLGESTITSADEYIRKVNDILKTGGISWKDLGIKKEDIVGKDTEEALKTITAALDDYVAKAKKALADLKDKGGLDEATSRLKTLKEALDALKSAQESVSTRKAATTEDLEKLATLVEGLILRIRELTGMNVLLIKPKELDLGSLAIQKLTNDLLKLENRKKTIGQVEMAISRWMGFYQVLNLTKRAVNSMKQHITELDTVMTKIAVVTNMSLDNLWGQIGKYSEMARQYGVAIKGVYEVSQLYYQQGLLKGDVMTLTQETLKMARIAGIEYSTAADYMTTAIRGFKLEMTDAGHVTDVFSNLAANTASSTEELAVAISKTAASAASVGSSFESTSAMMATMIATTRESATNIGTALKSIISRYGEMKENLTGTDAEGEEYSLNKVDKALLSIGISIHDAQGQFRDFDDVILELAEAWDTIDKNTQRYIATVMAGNRLQSRFLALVSNVEEYKRALSLANDSEGTGDILTLKTLDSVDAKVERLKVTIQEFYTSSGILDAYKKILDTITNVINASNKLPKIFDVIPALAISIGANLVSVIKNVLLDIVASIKGSMDSLFGDGESRLATFATKIADHIHKGFEDGATRGKLSLENATNNIGTNKTGMNIKNTAMRYGGMALSVAGSAFLIAGLNTYGSSTSKEQDMIAANLLGGGILGSIGGQALMGAAMSPVPWIGAALGGLMGVVLNLGSILSAFNMASTSLAREIELSNKKVEETSTKKTLAKGEEKALLTAVDKYKLLEEASYASSEAMQEFTDYLNQLAESYPYLVNNLDEAGNSIINLTELEMALAQARMNSAEATLLAAKAELELKEKELLSFNIAAEAAGNVVNGLDIASLIKDARVFLYKQGVPLSNDIYRDLYTASEIAHGRSTKDIFNSITAQWGANFDFSSLLLTHLDEYTELFNYMNEYFHRPKGHIIDVKSKAKTILENIHKLLPEISLGQLTHNAKIEKPEDIELLTETEITDALKALLENAQKKAEGLSSLIENINNAISSSSLDLELLTYLNNEDKLTSNLKNYSSFVEQMMLYLFGNVDWSDTKHKDVNTGKTNLQLAADYIAEWEQWLNKYSEDADWFINEFSYDNIISSDELRTILSLHHINDDIITKINTKYLDVIEGQSERYSEAIDQYLGFEGTEVSSSDIDTLKKLFTREGAEKGTNKLTVTLAKQFLSRAQEYKKLFLNGQTIDALNYAESLIAFYDSVGDLTSDTDKDKVADIIKDIDFRDVESLTSIADDLREAGYDKLADLLVESSLKLGVNVIAQSLNISDALKENIKGTEKVTEKIGKGMKYSDALETVKEIMDKAGKDAEGIALMETSGQKGFLSYDKTLGEYVLTTTAIDTWLSGLQNDLKDKIAALEKDTIKQTALYDSVLSKVQPIQKQEGQTKEDYDKAVANWAKEQVENNDFINQLAEQGIELSPNEKSRFARDILNLVTEFNDAQAENNELIWDTFIENKRQLLDLNKILEQEIIENATKNSIIATISSYDFNSIVSGLGGQFSKSNLITLLKSAGVNSTDMGFEMMYKNLLEGNFTTLEAMLALVGGSISTKTMDEAHASIVSNYMAILDSLNDPNGNPIDTALQALIDLIKALHPEIGEDEGKLRAFIEGYLLIAAEFGWTSLSQVQEKLMDSLKKSMKDKGVGKAKAVTDALKDNLTLDEIESLQREWSLSIVDKNGQLLNGLEQYYKLNEATSDYELLIPEGETLENVLTSILGILVGKIDDASPIFQELFANEVEREIKDLDAKDTGKKAAAVLSTIASAKVGTRVNVSDLPEELRKLLNANGKNIAEITSEFERDSWILALDANIIKDEEWRVMVREYQQLIKSKRNKGTAILSLIGSHITRDVMKSSLLTLRGAGVETWSDLTLDNEAKKMGFIWDSAMELYHATLDALTWFDQLITQAERDNKTPLYIESLRALREAVAAELNLNKKRDALSNLLSNYMDITSAVTEFSTLFGIGSEKLVPYYTEDITGAKKLDVTAFKAAFATELEKVLGENWELIFDDILNLLADASIENISKSIALATTGTTSMAEMKTFTDRYNELFKDVNATADLLFNYDALTESWTLRAEVMALTIDAEAQELVKNNQLKKEDVEAWKTSLLKANTVDKIDFKSVLSSGATDKSRKEMKSAIESYYIGLVDTVEENLIQYYKTQAELSESEAKELASKDIADALVKAKEKADLTYERILVGGEDAAKALKEVDTDATTEDLQAAYDYTIAPLRTLVDSVEDLKAGTYVASDQIEALTKAGFEVDENGLITSAGNLVQAYQSLYIQMSGNMQRTTTDLNKVYAKYMTEAERGDIDAIEVMGDAMGMSYEALGDMLANYDLDLESWMLLNQDLYKDIGGGKIRITNFAEMARRMNWEVGSEEYISAFKAYNDSLIELNRKTEKTILEEVKNIESANIGDLLNLTQFMDAYFKALAPELYLKRAALVTLNGSTMLAVADLMMSTALLNEFSDPIFNSLRESLRLAGANLSEGILELTENADKLEVLTILDDAIAKMEKANENLDFGDAHAQIKDSLNNIVKSYFDAISSGMSGNLSYLDAEKLSLYARRLAGKQLDFRETAEGLLLTEDSFFSLYAILKKTNKLMAKKLLPDMTNISGKYKNLGEALDEYAKALKNSDIEKADALRDLLDDMLANPDSYKLMDLETPSTWQSADNFYLSARLAYDVTQAMKSGSVGIGDFTAFAQSLIHSGNNEAKQMGLELLLKGADAIAVDKNGKSIVDTQLLAKILNVKNLDKWSSHYYDVWKNAAEDILKAGVKQLQAYNTLFFGSEALDGADIYDKNGDISSQKINNLIKKQDTQGKNIEALLSKIKTNGKTLADVVKTNKKLSPELQAALKAIINTDWENGLIEEQLTDAFQGKKGKIVFKDDGTFTIDLDSDFSINYEFNGKEVNADDYSRLVSMKAREGYEDLTKTLSASQLKAGMQKHLFKLGNMKVIATINADSSVEYTIDNVTYSGEQINALDSALSLKNAEILESFTPYDNKKPAKKAVRYLAGDVLITMAITASGIIQYEGKVSGANGETQTVVGENEQDVIAMMAALGDLGALKLITGLPHDDRTVSVNGQKYNIIVRNGITSIEFVNQDGSTSKNNFTEEAAKWWNNGNSTEPVNIPVDTPVEATATNVTIKVAEGATPTVDFGEEGLKLPEASGTVEKLTLSAKQIVSDTGENSIDINVTELPDLTLDANIDGVKGKIDEAVAYAEGKAAKQNIDVGTNALPGKIASNVSTAKSSPASQDIPVGSNAVPGLIDSNVAYASAHPAHLTITTSESEAGEATGNVALAKGKTLMGELGQELVVSHGRYYVVGTNGPEMVNLDDDAIVFNHIQTRLLLKNGKTPLHGRAVTNELEAAGMAHPTGTVRGLTAAEKKAAEKQRKEEEAAAKKAAAEAAKQAYEERGNKLTTQTKTKYDEGKDAINLAILKENRAKYDLSLSMGEKANLVREAKALRNSDAAKFYQQIELATFLKVIKPALAAAEASADAAQLQLLAAQQLSLAAKELSLAADATKQAASSVKGMRNEWASLLDPRGGLTAPGNLVHPNAAPKLADVFGGTTNANADASKKGNSYINDSLRGTGNTLNRNIDPSLAGYYKKNGGNAAGGGGSNEDNAKALKEAKSAVSSFLSDLLSLGIESIDLSKYEKLPGDIKSGIQERLDRNDSYRSFVEAYASALDKSMSEINETYFQAWLKDLEAVGLAEEQMESLEGLSFYANGEIGGSSSDWTTILGDKAFVGDAVKAGIFEWNAVLRQYIVQDLAALEQFMNTNIGNVWNFPEVAIDLALSVTDELNELLTKSISEGLSAKDKARAEELASKQGYTTPLEFSQDSKNKFRLKDNSVQGLAAINEKSSAETRDAIVARIKSITEIVNNAFGEDGLISYSDLEELENNLNAAELGTDIVDKVSDTGSGYIVKRFDTIVDIYNELYSKYPEAAVSFLKNISDSTLSESEKQAKATMLEAAGKVKESAELLDGIINDRADIISTLLKSVGEEGITNTEVTDLKDKWKRAYDVDFDFDFGTNGNNFSLSFDQLMSAYNTIKSKSAADAKKFLDELPKAIDLENLTAELLESYRKAIESAKATGAITTSEMNKAWAPVYDAMRERLMTSIDLTSKAIGGTATYSDIEDLKEHLKSQNNLGVSPQEIESRIQTVETEEGVRLIQDSYDWLIEIYSRVLPKKANELITTANETLISDLEYQELATEGALLELRSNWTWDSYSSLFTVSRDNLAKYASMRGVTLDESIFEDALRDKEGNYKLTVEQIEEYIGLFPEETRKATNKWFQEQGKITRKNIADALNGIIDTLIEKGANEIDFTDYDDLQEPIKDAISSDVFAMSKADIVKKWASELLKTVQETNELYFKAWEADLENNAVEAAKGMQYYLGGGLSGSSSDWTSLLGNNIKVSDLVESGLLSYNEKLNTYVATSLQSLQELGLDSDLFDTSIIEDSIRSLFDNILEQVSKAMNEGLTNLEVDLFMENLNLSGINLDLTFKQTVDGLKLSKESAIALYEELKKVDAIQAQLMFKKLNESLKETDDHYKNITKILARIKELQDLINDASQFDKAKINQYQQELNLAKEILAVRATSEDDSFDVANRALPGGLKNALTYANSLSDIAHEFRNAFENEDSDIIDFLMFYNMANEINDAAGVLGKSINFFGYTLNGGIDNLDSLITHAADSLGSSVDGNKFGVSLTKFGNDLSGSMDSFAGSADKAMHTMAETLIQILDGLIAMFEVIVAMELFDGSDFNKNGLLDLEEIFDLTGLTEDAYDTATKFNLSFSNAASIILETITKDTRWREVTDAIKVNGYTFTELLLDAADGVRDIMEVSAQEYASMISVLYEALRNGDYDINDIYNSLKENLTINDSSFGGTIEINDMVINLKYSAQLTKTEEGYVTPGGATYPDVKSAALGLALEAVGGTEVTFDPITLTSTGTLQVGSSTLDITVSTDDSEAVVYNAPSGLYTSLNDAIKGEWLVQRDSGETTLELEEWEIDLKIKIVPVIAANLEESALELNLSQINAAIGKSYDDIKAEWDAALGSGEELQFEAKYGIALNETTTEEDWARFKELAGIETKNIELNASINIVNSDEILNQLLSTNPEDLSVTFNVSAPVTEALQEIDNLKTYIDNTTGTITVEALTQAAQDATSTLKGQIDNTGGTVSVDANTSSAYSSTNALQNYINGTSGSVYVDAATSSAQSKLDSIVSTIDQIDTSIDITVNVTLNGEIPSTSDSGSSSAKGTVNGSAMASGTKTLMGELGPELYVSNGRYHLAGQNGAEFVNLPDDAIVFNHLLTQRLLATGSAGRGQPVTNEYNAVAMARGTSGPAAANARETLATLKQIRAMWQSIANMSITELAGHATDKGSENIATWIQQIEKWFTLMQKIATLEKEITQELKIRAALLSKLIASGDLYADSLVRSVNSISEELELLKQLADSHLKEYEQMRKNVNNNSPFNRFFTFDEKGQIIYDESHYLELVDLLNTQYEDNSLAKSKPLEQVELAKQYKLSLYMLYDSEGKRIIQEENESDSEFAVRQLDALKYSMDKMKEEIQGEYDAYYESINSALDLEADRNAILAEMRDNLLNLEEKVLNAIEDLKQATIDKLSDEREKLSKMSSDYILGLQDSLNKERQMYEQDKDKTELQLLQRRLAILQRSGGSQAEISSLLKEIQEKNRDAYFDAQEQLIQTIQDASDLQLEKLQTQIDILTESLEYSKEHGLLWAEVNEILKGTSDEITAFITGNMSDWLSKSALALEKELLEILFMAQEFTLLKEYNTELLNNVTDSVTAKIEEVIGAMPPESKIEETVQLAVEGVAEVIEEAAVEEATAETIPDTATTITGSSNYGLNYLGPLTNIRSNGDTLAAAARNTKALKSATTLTAYTLLELSDKERVLGQQITALVLLQQNDPKLSYDAYQRLLNQKKAERWSTRLQYEALRLKLYGYSHGGMVTETGLVKVHGTEARPEAFMNAEEVQMWKQQILGRGSHSLLSLMLEIRALYDEISGVSSSVTHNNDSVVIEHAEVNMNVELLANDYDARRAGANALDEMLKIARKTGANSVRR